MKYQKIFWLLTGIVVALLIIILRYYIYGGPRTRLPAPEKKTVVPAEYVFVDPRETDSAAPAAVQAAPQTAPETAPAQPAPQEAVRDIPFSIQVASFKNKEAAQRLVEKLKEEGHAAFMAEKDLKEKGIWYRVHVGVFSTMEAAVQYSEKLKDKGIFIIVKP